MAKLNVQVGMTFRFSSVPTLADEVKNKRARITQIFGDGHRFEFELLDGVTTYRYVTNDSAYFELDAGVMPDDRPYYETLTGE